MKKIKAFIMDVDGTMTDGKIYMGAGGEMFKAFDIKDGYGIHEILPKNQVKTVIMTGRASEIVQNRADELEIDIVMQNIKDKEKAVIKLAEEFGCGLDEFAYMGDDIIDLKPMLICGVSGCPRNAVERVMEAADYVSDKNGGDGAVRDFIEWLAARNFTGVDKI